MVKEKVPPYLLSLWIPPPLLLAVLPEMVEVEMVIVPLLLIPPPTPLVAVLPEIVVLVMVIGPAIPYLPSLFIPPPLLVAVLPVIVDPVMVMDGAELLIPAPLLALLPEMVVLEIFTGPELPYLPKLKIPPPLPVEVLPVI